MFEVELGCLLKRDDGLIVTVPQGSLMTDELVNPARSGALNPGDSASFSLRPRHIERLREKTRGGEGETAQGAWRTDSYFKRGRSSGFFADLPDSGDPARCTITSLNVNDVLARLSGGRESQCIGLDSDLMAVLSRGVRTNNLRKAYRLA